MDASIGIFGGSSFLKLHDKDVEFVTINTPYGTPSSPLSIIKYKNKNIAFLPRHGTENQLMPHEINYRANIWAMKSLGIERIIAPCAAGSLKKEIKPGDFVVCKDIIDFTNGHRIDTFYASPNRTHIHMENTYCPQLRNILINVIESKNFTFHREGDMVVINGPRFATKAESKGYIQHGWDMINMTQYPECYLAKELDICYASIAFITDYDIGVENIPLSPLAKMKEIFKTNFENLKSILFETIDKIILLDEKTCSCGNTSKLGQVQ